MTPINGPTLWFGKACDKVVTFFIGFVSLPIFPVDMFLLPPLLIFLSISIIDFLPLLHNVFHTRWDHGWPKELSLRRNVTLWRRVWPDYELLTYYLRIAVHKCHSIPKNATYYHYEVLYHAGQMLAPPSHQAILRTRMEESLSVCVCKDTATDLAYLQCSSSRAEIPEQNW